MEHRVLEAITPMARNVNESTRTISKEHALLHSWKPDVHLIGR